MRILILSIIVSSVLFTFTNCQKKNYIIPKLNTEKFLVYEENQQLLDNILSFIENETYPNVISLNYYEKYDTACFEISPVINLFSIEYYPSVYYFELNESIIIIFSEMNELKRYSGEILDSLMNKCFPESFLYYKENGHSPIVRTYECDRWKLKFVNGKLCEREKIPYLQTEENKWTKERFN